MLVSLILQAGETAIIAASRKVHKRRAKRLGCEYASVPRDTLGRPLDPNNRRRKLSRNEERALLEHNRSISEMNQRELTWLRDGSRLPEYGQQGGEGPTGQWSVEAAPLYSEEPESSGSSDSAQHASLAAAATSGGGAERSVSVRA